MKKIVIVLGMHRSGTSVVSQLCQCMGAYLGEESELMVATEANPDGYFENEKISYINDRILNFSEREWYSLGMLETDYNSPQVKKAERELRDSVQQLLSRAETNTIAVKDPRISILLPIWEKILDELDGEVHYIWVFRNPLEVVESLRKRNGYSKEHSLLLWAYYNLNILKFLKNKEYLLINYRDILEDFGTIKQLNNFINEKYVNILEENLESVVKSGYCHSNYSNQVLWHISDKWIQNFYNSLLNNEERKLDIPELERLYMANIFQIKDKYINFGSLEIIKYIQEKNIIIYGAGNYGKQAANMLQQINIKYDFCDRDINKHGKTIMNGKVLSIMDIEEKKNLCIIIAVEKEKTKQEIEQTLVYLKGARFLSFLKLKEVWKYYVNNASVNTK